MRPSPRRDALLLLTGSASQDLAFRVAQVALPLVVLAETGSVSAMGLVAGCQGLPILASPWWARRVRQLVGSGRALALVAILDALALCIVPLAVEAGVLTVGVLALTGLLLGIGETLGHPGRTALLADVGDRIGPDGAVVLLTRQDLLRRAGSIVGPAAGGIAVGAGLTVELLWLQAAAVLGAGLLVWPIQGEPGTATTEGDAAAPGIREALATRPEVRAGWWMRGASCLTWFSLSLGLAVLGVEAGRPGELYAIGISGYGVGSVLGTFVAIRLVRRFSTAALASAGWATSGVAWMAMALDPRPIAIAASAAVGAGSLVVGITAVNAAITTSSAGAVRRTLLSGQTVVVSAGVSAGMLVGGSIIEMCGVRPTMFACGVLVTATALAARPRATWQTASRGGKAKDTDAPHDDRPARAPGTAAHGMLR